MWKGHLNVKNRENIIRCLILADIFPKLKSMS